MQPKIVSARVARQIRVPRITVVFEGTLLGVPVALERPFFLFPYSVSVAAFGSSGVLLGLVYLTRGVDLKMRVLEVEVHSGWHCVHVFERDAIQGAKSEVVLLVPLVVGSLLQRLDLIEDFTYDLAVVLVVASFLLWLCGHMEGRLRNSVKE